MRERKRRKEPALSFQFSLSPPLMFLLNSWAARLNLKVLLPFQQARTCREKGATNLEAGQSEVRNRRELFIFSMSSRMSLAGYWYNVKNRGQIIRSDSCLSQKVREGSKTPGYLILNKQDYSSLPHKKFFLPFFLISLNYYYY